MDEMGNNNIPQEVLDVQQKGQAVLELTGEDDQKFYFRFPDKNHINRLLASTAKGKLASAIQDLVFDLVIYPGQQELRRRCDEMPGCLVAINNALQNAVGLNEEFSVKKLPSSARS